MLLLLLYITIAVGFSFLCSIAEAVLLSVNNPYIALLEQEKRPSGKVLRELKDDINKPLAVILSLNTIAHTIGAAGAGAQAAAVFGSTSVGIVSAILTLVILIFSEIIPKALGANYWRQLAPFTGVCLKYLIKLLYPFVLLSESLIKILPFEPTLQGFNRKEFAAMAVQGEQEGMLEAQELSVLKNLLLLRDIQVKHVMTPRSVVFSLAENLNVDDFFDQHQEKKFSRIPLKSELDEEEITGFVLLNDLLLEQAKGNGDSRLQEFHRDLPALISSISVSRALETLLENHAPMMLVVDEYGSMLGIVTLEDLLETLIGQEIIDEGDATVDMQKLARRLAKRRKKALGLKSYD